MMDRKVMTAHKIVTRVLCPFCVALFAVTAASSACAQSAAATPGAGTAANQYLISPPGENVTVPLLRAASLRGLYVDGFDAILGNSSEVDGLVQFVNNQGVQYLCIYKFNDMWNRPADVQNFLLKIRTQCSAVEQIGISGGWNGDFAKAVSYNDGHSQKFDVLYLESEFWLTSGPERDAWFSAYKSTLRYMKGLAGPRGLLVEAYVGWPGEQECHELVPLVDRLLVHAYVGDPVNAYEYMKERLSWLASAMKPIEIRPIFSAEYHGTENRFMGQWLRSNTMFEAEAMWAQQLAADAPPWRDGVVVGGFQWFSYLSYLNAVIGAVNMQLYWQLPSGRVVSWRMNADGTKKTGTSINNAQTTWQVRAAGDIDWDGVADLIWQLPTGQVYCWLMNANGTRRASFFIRNTATAWQVRAAGDIDGDGIADLVWQLPTGQVYCWLMNADGIQKSSFYISNAATTWQVRGTGDIDKDGVADLIWQLPTGQVACWLMNASGTKRSGVSIYSSSTAWRVRGVSDIDCDGVPDLFWQLPTGQVLCWLMNANGKAKSSFYVSNTATTWQVRCAGW